MTPSDQDQRTLLAAVADDWLNVGSAVDPADRAKAELGAWEAYQAVGERVPQLLIWVPSPMAGVLASTYVGFALGTPMTTRLTAPLEAALASNTAAALDVRRTVDWQVWHVLRSTIHGQVTTDLAQRGPAFEAMKNDIGNATWTQVWEEVGDQVFAQSWDADARAADGLFEENLTPWADAMMDGQFGAGAMAQLDALDLLGEVDPQPFTGIRRAARSCGWWWPYEAGAIFCERPAAVSVDGELEFRDGWTART